MLVNIYYMRISFSCIFGKTILICILDFTLHTFLNGRTVSKNAKILFTLKRKRYVEAVLYCELVKLHSIYTFEN